MLKKPNDHLIQNIRGRLILIIESVLSRKQNELKFMQSQLSINEGKLQLWQQTLDQVLIVKGEIQKPLNSFPLKETNLPLIQLPPCSLQQDFEQTYLLSFGKDQIIVYDPMNSDLTSKRLPLKFKENIIKKHASYNFISTDQCIIAGGCHSSIPNKKSNTILLFSITSQQLTKHGQLSQGISSHGSIFIYPFLYIIGGNRNHNIISKYCYTYNIESRIVAQISSLNYSVASMAVCKWGQDWIYKIGGIGQSFGSWDVSPYIERYSLLQDFWEVVNPQIKISSYFMNSFNLLAHSTCYRNAKASQIVVLGGYGFNKQPTNVIFSLKVPQKEDQQHQILKFGKTSLKRGGFRYNNCLYKQAGSTFYSIQNIESGQQKLLTYCLGMARYN